MDLNAVAQDLFDELKSRYSELTLGDDTAQTTIDPQSARFFKFSWNNNAVSISLDEETLRLVYNKDLTNSLDEDQEQDNDDYGEELSSESSSYYENEKLYYVERD